MSELPDEVEEGLARMWADDWRPPALATPEHREIPDPVEPVTWQGAA